MTVEYDWHHVYSNAVEQFGGDTPSATLEAELLEIFQQRPEDLVAAINKIGGAYRQGKVQSPWGALKSEIARLRNRPHLVVQSGKQTTKRIKNAEQWIRNAGLHYPGWGACRETLTDDFHLTPEQADALQIIYDEYAPIGQQLEQDATDRARQWREAQARLAEIAKAKRDQLDAIQEAAKP